jgi:uncharacterized protein YyaL (SSP411 family)
VGGVDWQPWSASVFARARDERKPVLLSIEATWCAASLEMARTTYADPLVCDLVGARFVSIRVDADRRPDIAERYLLGGLPTTAFLDPGGAIVGGGTFVPADRMIGALTRAADALPSMPPADPLLPHAAEPQSRSPLLDDDLIAATFATFDADHGGFGLSPKFPLTAPIDLALAIYRDSRDAHMAHVAESTLDAMGWGELFDEADGGFFRCAGTRDWRQPRREKLLDVNAALLRLYVEAADALRITRYRERAGDILRYVQTWLADQADGGWAGSQRGDDDYYAAAAEERLGRTAPPVDGTLYSAANAAMASAALRASLVLDDNALGEFALRSLERVLLAAYSPGAGVAHYIDDGRAYVRGLLDDQVAMASAQLDAHEATGNIVYEMMAQELMHFAVRTMWDEEGGGFFDRSVADDGERVGLMATRLKPFVTNCDAVRVLRRLAAVTGEREFADRADAAHAAMAGHAEQQGPLAACYLLARA